MYDQIALIISYFVLFFWKYIFKIDAVIAVMRHSEVGLLVSSALHSVACYDIKLVCLHVF